MNNTDYNDYMLNLYKDCTINVFNKEKEAISYKVNDMFAQNSALFNNHIANKYLESLHDSNISPIPKIMSYPYMFWKTPEGQPKLDLILEDLQNNYKESIVDIIESSQSISKHHIDKEQAQLHRANQLLNGCGPGYTNGLYQNFMQDMLKIQSLNLNVDIKEQIEKFFSNTYKLLNKANINPDYSHLPEELNKVFKNTSIHKQLKSIDFINLLEPHNKTNFRM